MKKLSVQESTSLFTSPFSPSLRLSGSPQMDNKGWNGQKAPFTETTSNSEYRHVSQCLFPFPLLLLSLSPIFPSVPWIVLATKTVRRLIYLTGQWSSDCQISWPCLPVGSLWIQAHSHRLTGPPHRDPPGSPHTTFLCRNVAFHWGLTHRHTKLQMHSCVTVILQRNTKQMRVNKYERVNHMSAVGLR